MVFEGPATGSIRAVSGTLDDKGLAESEATSFRASFVGLDGRESIISSHSRVSEETIACFSNEPVWTLTPNPPLSRPPTTTTSV
jgi:hypothetical protein